MTTNTKNKIETLRKMAAELLASPQADRRVEGQNLLKMIEIVKMRALCNGEDVVVYSAEGKRWDRARLAALKAARGLA